MRPYLRPAKHWWLRTKARRLASTRRSGDDAPSRIPFGFIVGCGRSGTTILGELIDRHPEVCYLFEPFHLWAVIEPRTDAGNMFVRVDGDFFMDADDATPEAKVRFNRTMLHARDHAGAKIIVEKTAHNVARIGFLDALAPEARFLNIVRNGLDVVRSIDRLATRGDYRIAGRSGWNQWWGEADAKWTALSAGGRAAGYFPDEIDQLATHPARAAYEWVTSIAEADRWREPLGRRMYELRYSDLTTDTAGVMREVCLSLGVSCPRTWIDEIVRMVRPERKNEGASLVLPPALCARFNEYQERYDFAGRARPSDAAA